MTMTRKHFEEFAVSYGDSIAWTVNKYDTQSQRKDGKIYLEALTDAITASIYIFRGFNSGFDSDRFNRRVLQVAINTMEKWQEMEDVEVHSKDNIHLWGLLQASKSLFEYDEPMDVIKSI